MTAGRPEPEGEVQIMFKRYMIVLSVLSTLGVAFIGLVILLDSDTHGPFDIEPALVLSVLCLVLFTIANAVGRWIWNGRSKILIEDKDTTAASRNRMWLALGNWLVKWYVRVTLSIIGVGMLIGGIVSAYTIFDRVTNIFGLIVGVGFCVFVAYAGFRLAYAEITGRDDNW